MKTHLGLFEGIGGFSLAARWMGWETLAWCEWNEFGQRILKHHFPNAEGFGDITKTDFKKYANKIDIITGGFPCQPFSLAGKRKGTDDERYLWHEMLRAIQEIKPKFVIAENVFGITNIDGGLVFEQVCLDLENEGYKVQPFVIPACAKNAPHRRDRVWFIAQNTNQNGWRSDKRKKESEIGRFGDISTGDNERICVSKESIADTTGNGYDDKPTTRNNVIGSDNKQTGTQWERSFERFSDERNASDTNSRGLEGSIEVGWNSKYAFGENSTNAQESNATNTENKRQEWGKEGQRPKDRESFKSTKQLHFIQSKGWQEFPTQPPICSGDDGLPTELDGITFSKWRSESIKGYGNAIVPQVAYEIFKIIENI